MLSNINFHSLKIIQHALVKCAMSASIKKWTKLSYQLNDKNIFQTRNGI